MWRRTRDTLELTIGYAMTACESSLTHASAAAILANRTAIVSTWMRLLQIEDSPLAHNQAIMDQADACVVTFAGYLLGDAIADSVMARHWRELQPSRELIADATVAMGLFVEAVRQTLATQPDLPFDATDVIPVASQFVREVTLAILGGVAIRPDEQAWVEVAEELDRIRARRAARISALTDIARAVTTVSNPEDLFDQVHAACSRIVNGDDFSITFYDAETGACIPRLLYIGGERRRDLENQPIGPSLSRIVVETQEPLAVPDYVEACRAHGIDPGPPFDHDRRLAWMAAPMALGDYTFGVISVFNPLMPFEREDVELLAGIARHTAVALENSRLITAQRRRANQLKAVNQLARRIVTLRDPEVLLSTAVELIHEIFGYAIVSLFLVDPSRKELVLRAHSVPENVSKLLSLRFPIGSQSIVGDVAATATVALVKDVSQDPRYFSTPQTQNTRSEVAVPILCEGTVLGVLDVQSTQPTAFDDHDVTTLLTIADQIAVALENARLFKEEHERSRALSLMLGTTRAAGSSLVLDEVLQRLAEGIAEAGGNVDCVIYLLDEDNCSLIPTATVVGENSKADHARLRTTTLRIPDSPVIREIMEQNEPFFCREIQERVETDLLLTELIGGVPAMAVPLAARGRILGVALVLDRADGSGFTPEQVRLLRGVADSAALAVENARLYARSQGLAIAEERGRLAQQIHDTLAQGLTAISLHLDLADAYLPGKPEQAAEKVRRALELTRHNLEEARRSVLDLRAAHLHQMSLPDALRRLVQTFSRETGIAADFTAEGLSGRLSARVEMGLYRIAEEALTNVRRHSGANHARVMLTARSGKVSLIVQDDGAGFDEAAARERGTGIGFGLVGIRERARLLRGSLNVKTAPGCGTTVAVTVPFEGTMAQQAVSEEPLR